MTLMVVDSGALAVLILRGNLKSDEADELKTCLRRAFVNVNRLIVNCAEVTGMDSGCLNILCSAYRRSQSMRKSIVLAGHQPKLFLQAVQATDYVNCVGCGLESDHGCLWGVC